MSDRRPTEVVRRHPFTTAYLSATSVVALVVLVVERWQ